MRIGLDVDGVLYQWSPTARRILEREYGVVISESQTWNWIQDHCSKEQWKALWSKHLLELYTLGDYYPGAQQVVADLISFNWEVFFITATPNAVRTARAIRLFSDFPDISGVNFVAPYSDNKTFVECDVYLDDRPETAILTAEEGQRSLLMNRPYNAHVVHPKVTRVYNWKQLLQEVER